MALFIEPGSNREYFEKVCAWASAKSAQHAQWLFEQLWHCHTYGEKSDGEPDWPKSAQELVEQRARFELYPDSCPGSFGFLYQRLEGNVYRTRYNGGLIYHGDVGGWERHDGSIIPDGYRAETYSVRIGYEREQSPWSMHT